MSQIRIVASGKIGIVHVLMASACQFMSNHEQRFQNSVIFYWANMLISYLKDILYSYLPKFIQFNCTDICG